MYPTTVFITSLLLLVPALCQSPHKNREDTVGTKLSASFEFPSFISHSEIRFSSSRIRADDDNVGDDAVDDSGHRLVHGRTIKPARLHYPSLRPGFLTDNETVLTSDSFSSDVRLRPTVGNGHVATVVKNDAIFMNGLFNGHNVTSHRARIPSPLISSLAFACPVLFNNLCASTETYYELDVGRGIFVETHKANDFIATLTTYAHRSIPQLLVQELDIINTLQWSLTVTTFTNSGNASEDIDFTTKSDINSQIRTGRTRQAEYDITGLLNVTVISSNIPKTIYVGSNERETHLFLVSVDKDYSTAKQAFNDGVAKFMSQTLQDSHSEAWFDVWRNGRLAFEGNVTLSRITYGAMYYILSALPLKPTPDFVGLSPGDLAHGALNKDYQGHVFWDQETWMYPPIQMLHADIGRAIINSRIRVLDTAKQYAQSRGYRGAMFPWESALSGLNVCPWDPATLYEQHVTGDVSLAMRQYVLMTNDTDFLTTGRGLEAITEIANFWASRVQLKPGTNLYEILDVMPPDEYHQKVNNSAYTNVIAKISLLLPKLAYGLIGRTVNPRYEDIARRMYVPFDSRDNYHPEYDGYARSVTVKQADVVLLGYPLMEPMHIQIRKNDLEYYKTVTPGGPAMTWGMFSIGYLEINETQLASEMFLKQLGNVVPPFNIWTENIHQEGAVNFITGMGGYLQSLIFGYGGFRMYPGYLQFSGSTPPGVSSFNVTGIDYLGGSLDFTFFDSAMTVTQTKMASKSLQITLSLSGIKQTLTVGHQMLYKSQKASISPVLD